MDKKKKKRIEFMYRTTYECTLCCQSITMTMQYCSSFHSIA